MTKRVADEMYPQFGYIEIERPDRPIKNYRNQFSQAVANINPQQVAEVFPEVLQASRVNPTSSESSICLGTFQDIRIRVLAVQLLNNHAAQNSRFMYYLSFLSLQRWINPYQIENLSFTIQGVEPRLDVQSPFLAPTQNGFRFYWPGNAVEFSNFKVGY